MPVLSPKKSLVTSSFKLLTFLAMLGIPSNSWLQAYPAVAQSSPKSTATKSIWKLFNSQAGGFSLLMPGQPIESESDGVKSYSVTRAKESVTYTVSFIDFPINPEQEKNGIAEAFTGIKDGIIEEGGKIQQEQSIALKGYPGKELRVSMPDGALTRVRSYIVGKRLYLIMASTNNEKNLRRSLQGFLDSFRVKPELVPDAIPAQTPLPEKVSTPSDPAAPQATPSPETNPPTSTDNQPNRSDDR